MSTCAGSPVARASPLRWAACHTNGSTSPYHALVIILLFNSENRSLASSFRSPFLPEGGNGTLYLLQNAFLVFCQLRKKIFRSLLPTRPTPSSHIIYGIALCWHICCRGTWGHKPFLRSFFNHSLRNCKVKTLSSLPPPFPLPQIIPSCVHALLQSDFAAPPIKWWKPFSLLLIWARLLTNTMQWT